MLATEWPSEQLQAAPGYAPSMLPYNSVAQEQGEWAFDWTFQGVDMAFFDSLMRGADPGGLEQ